MEKEQEIKIKNELLNIYEKHLANALRNVLRKTSLDVKNDLVNILETDNKDLLRDSKIYLEDITDILYNDLKQNLENFLKEYYNK